MKTTTIVLLALLLSGCALAVPAGAGLVASDGPGTYTVLKDSSGPVRIPFRMHNGKPLMDLEINGRPATLMIDNGILWDQVWLFGSPLVDALKLERVEEASIGGAGEGDPTDAYTSTNLTLRFADIVFFEQPSFVSPPAAGFARMFPGADGQLCNTFFKHFIVEFDFMRREVILHDPASFVYAGGGSVLDMTANDSGTHSIPFAFVMNDGTSYSGKADVDFGGIYGFKAALNNSLDIRPPRDARPTTSAGAQGLQHELVGKIRRMTIGAYSFDGPEVYFGDETTSRIHPDNLGVVGLPLLMKFDVIFDYVHGRLYLEPNESCREDPTFGNAEQAQ